MLASDVLLGGERYLSVLEVDGVLVALICFRLLNFVPGSGDNRGREGRNGQPLWMDEWMNIRYILLHVLSQSQCG